jgi:hypothetical protein
LPMPPSSADRAKVAEAFLEAVMPAEIDALSRARKAQRRTNEALRHAEEQQVQRLRYQAALAKRQFNRVDPDNRLVAGELERRWEAALIALRRAEEALTRSTAAAAPQPVGVNPRLRGKVVALVSGCRHCGQTLRPDASIARRCCAARSRRSSCAEVHETKQRSASCGGRRDNRAHGQDAGQLVKRTSAPCRDGTARLRASRPGVLR